MGPTLCLAVALAAVTILGAGCAKAHVDPAAPASAAAATATDQPAGAGTAAGRSDALDWTTVKPAAPPVQPCVHYPATGNYHVCLAADGFGCVHFGDYCEPGPGAKPGPNPK